LAADEASLIAPHIPPSPQRCRGLRVRLRHRSGVQQPARQAARTLCPAARLTAARLPSLRDPEWGSGLHLLYLLEALRPGCVAWDAVTEGTTPQEQEANARYLASLALLLGVPGPALAWQDVVAVKPRAILLFLAGAWLLAAGIRRLKEGDKEDEGSDDEDSEEE
jgi:hypothetical protein